MDNCDSKHLEYLRRAFQEELGYAILSVGGTTIYSHSAPKTSQESSVNEILEEDEGLGMLLN